MRVQTDVLLVGKEPGYAKVSQAQAQGCALLSLEDVRQGVLVRGSIADVMRGRRQRPLEIESFSAGFRGNGLARQLAHRRAAELRTSQHVRDPSPAARASSKPRTSPSTTALTSKTAAKQPQPPPAASRAPPPPAPPPVKATLEYTAAPLETIDLSAIKPSRFLLPPAALPYRDEAGRISLHLCRDSAARLESGAVSAPAEVAAKLRSWLKHAEHAVRKGGHEWVRDADGAWIGPGGERRLVVVAFDAETDDEEDDGDGDGDGDVNGDGDGDGGDAGSGHDVSKGARTPGASDAVRVGTRDDDPAAAAAADDDDSPDEEESDDEEDAGARKRGADELEGAAEANKRHCLNAGNAAVDCA